MTRDVRTCLLAGLLALGAGSIAALSADAQQGTPRPASGPATQPSRNAQAPAPPRTSSGPGAASAADPARALTVNASPGEYLIGVEDVLEILVWKTPELTRTVSVRPDGRISLPLLNDVTVVNQTPTQVREQLLKAYSQYLTEAEISVIVTEIHSVKVSVLGQVNLPGRYELRSRTTVLDALALAGGLAEFAKRDQIVVYRPQDSSAWKTFGFDYARLVSNMDINQNFALGPGDIILVP